MKKQENQITEYTKNGVHVKVTRSENGSVVECDCQCFGNTTRCHSNSYCPNLKSQVNLLQRS
jgi:hypothetical protein